MIKNKSLIIGNTSQLNHYFPNEFDRISSRNIDFTKIKKNNYDSIYLLFAEQRTFLNETESFFLDINFDFTLKVIDELKNYCNRIIIYSTSELWNNYSGEVSLEMSYQYNYSPYIKSKELLCNYINENREKYNNVVIIYPFNFNSIYRKNGYLFFKVFDSLINKNKNFIGDININRDIIHPSIIVNNSITANKDKLIGGGELVNIQKFISDLFSNYNMNYQDYLINDSNNNLTNHRNEYYSKIKYSNYNELLNLTFYDIRQNKFS